MPDIGKIITNPWVLAGGAGIGLILLMSRSSGASDAGTAFDPSYGIAGMQIVTERAAIAADVTKTRINAQMQSDASFAAMISNLTNARYVRDVSLSEIDAGVTIGKINAATMLELDRNDNLTKLQGQRRDGKTQIALAKIAGKTQRKIAKTNGALARHITNTEAEIAQSQMWGNIFNSLAGGVFSLFNPAEAVT